MISRVESPSFPSYAEPGVLHESPIVEPLPADAQTDVSFVAEYRIVSTARGLGISSLTPEATHSL